MSFSILEKTVFQFWEQLDCPTSLGLKLLAQTGDWTAVLTHKVKPENFTDPIEYAKANAAVAFLKKCPAVPGISSAERQRLAKLTWLAGEASCFKANERLSPFIISPSQGTMPAKFLRGVRRRLLNWLRHAPSDAELAQRARHGPGTTFSSSVANPTAADKYDDRMSVTSDACWFLASIVGTKWGAITASRYVSSLDDCIDFPRGNRWTTVPKTALTDRNIAIEPTLNIYYQLAVGSCIRGRMRKYAGWDLDNAATLHRKMARQASIDGSFATIDLSNASDSLCKNLVRVLLQDTPWFSLLDDLRSKRSRIDGKWHLLEKFSSMGNGYTFELESAIFAAICAECLSLEGIEPILGHNLFVFGDDIIVPTETVGLVVAALRWTGFETNEEKTFLHGSFRESCGGDFFLGHPVRGFYLKTGLTRADPSKLYTVHNGVKIILENCKVNPFSFLEYIRNLLPSRLRHIGGSTRLGDTVLHGLDPTFKWKSGIRWVKAVRWSNPILVRWNYFSEEARLACRLTSYGHTHGIDSRGVKRCSEIAWVSDS